MRLSDKECYLTGNHMHAYRPGKEAVIMGVVMVTVDGVDRACFKSIHQNGVIDYVPISEVVNGKYVVS